jgi:hypothetical protein
MLVGEEKDGTHRVGERIMSNVQENDETEGKEKVVTLKTYNIIVLAFTALTVVVLILAFPLIEQTHIHVEVAQGEIIDVWVETPQVSLISTIISPPTEIGANTINVTIPQTEQSFQVENVPDGEYVMVWVTNGKPASGAYTIKVNLLQNDIIVNTFDLNLSF